MKNYVYCLMGLIFIVFLYLSLKSCTNSSTTLVVDSVFINQYEKGESYGPLYIYFHFSIINESSDTININLPISSFDEKTQEHNYLYGIYRNDTIPFYSGTNILVKPDEKTNFTVRYGSSINIIDMYENHYNQEFDNIQSFMHDLVVNSKIFFASRSLNYTVLTSKIKINYRDPEDKGEHTWPL